MLSFSLDNAIECFRARPKGARPCKKCWGALTETDPAYYDRGFVCEVCIRPIARYVLNREEAFAAESDRRELRELRDELMQSASLDARARITLGVVEARLSEIAEGV